MGDADSAGVDSYYRNGSDGLWPLQDSIGSVVGKVSSGGTIQSRQSFGPFGEEAAGNSASGNGKGFTGRDRVGNGLLYFRNRMYSPLLGRFISEDPLGWEAGPNFFAYCHNDPINFNDPLGLAESDPFLCGRGDACAYGGGFKSVPYGRPEDYEERRAAIDEAMSSALIGIALSMDMGNHGSPNERILGFRGGGYFRFTGGKGSYSGGGPRTLKGPHNTIRRVIPDKGQAGETDFDTGIITLLTFHKVCKPAFRKQA